MVSLQSRTTYRRQSTFGFKNKSISKLENQDNEKEEEAVLGTLFHGAYDDILVYDANVARILKNLINEIECTKVAVFKPDGVMDIYTLSLCEDNLALLVLEEAQIDKRKSQILRVQEKSARQQ